MLIKIIIFKDYQTGHLICLDSPQRKNHDTSSVRKGFRKLKSPCRVQPDAGQKPDHSTESYNGVF